MSQVEFANLVRRCETGIVKPGAVFNNDYFLALFAVSMVCLLILIGVTLYSGSFLPSTGVAGGAEATTMWVLWSLVAGVPLLTLIWWLISLFRS